MRKKQTINAILHLPTTAAGREYVERQLRECYIYQVEKQLNNYNLTKAQKIQVVSQLAAEYREKAKMETKQAA